MRFTLDPPKDVLCERCTRLVARIVQDQIQVKAGKQVIHTRGPISVTCWHCSHTNLIGVKQEKVTGTPAMASS